MMNDPLPFSGPSMIYWMVSKREGGIIMGKRKKKRDPMRLTRWIVALTTAAVLTLLLVRCLPPAPQSMAGAVPGIDVSSHQGDIDWQAVADSGMQFAIIRLGYRGYDDGVLHTDEKAIENLAQARAAGLKIGAYFFSQALNEAEAREEAALALEVLDGMALDLPIAYDWEYVSEEKRTGDMDPDTLVSCVHAFCGEVEAAGYQPMVYFNRELSRTLLDLEEVAQYPFWYARYDEELRFDKKVQFWQHSDQGQLPGIQEKVDLNWYFPVVGCKT